MPNRTTKMAMKINGQYIENLIPGYATLSVSGRESLETSLTIVDKSVDDGSVYRRKKYPSRTLSIGFVIQNGTNAQLRSKLDTLASILNVEEAKFIFDDESDKYYIGTPGQNATFGISLGVATGSFDIVCSDPFKYAINEDVAEIQATDDTGLEYTYAIVPINNGGYKTYPRFEVTFPTSSTDGQITNASDCGYVYFEKYKNYIPIFSSLKTYKVGDVVFYSEYKYICHTAINTPGPWDEEVHWTKDDLYTSESYSMQFGNKKEEQTGSRDIENRNFLSTSNVEWQNYTQVGSELSVFKYSALSKESSFFVPTQSNKYYKNDSGVFSVMSDFNPTLWNNSSTYSIGDYVIKDGKLYLCKVDGTTGSWNSKKWTYDKNAYKKYYVASESPFTISGSTNIQQLSTTNGLYVNSFDSYSSFSSSVHYNQNDIVVYNNIIYKCKVNNYPASGSKWKTSYWTENGFTNFHGPAVCYTVPANKSFSGNFSFEWTQVLYSENKAYNGLFGIAILDSNNNPLLIIEVEKTSTSGTSANEIVYAPLNNSSYYKTNSVSITKKAKEDNNYSLDKNGKKRLNKSTIKREGSTYTIKLANTNSYTIENGSTADPKKFIFFFGRKTKVPFLTNANAVETAYINSGQYEANTFGSNDSLSVDVATMEVLHRTKSEASLGDITNDWSNMYLDVGENLIFMNWSNFMINKPNLKVYFRKRWI